MQTPILSLEDLSPQSAEFTLSGAPDKNKKYLLCRWSLRVKAWAISKYTHQGLEKIFGEKKIEDIAVIAYFMLQNKEDFPTLESFLDSIVGPMDELSIMLALLKTIGIGEPQLERITKSMDEASAASPNDQTPAL
jgi:hypothetical protein